MGDNATKKWEWHNTVVGEGYAARGVIRQKTLTTQSVQIVDLSKPLHESAVEEEEEEDEDDRHKRKREKKETSKKHKKHEKSAEAVAEFRFNPLLQLLARRLREKMQR